MSGPPFAFMQVFIACGIGKAAGQVEDPFRKPKTGMWQIMKKYFNSGTEVDLNQLIFTLFSSYNWLGSCLFYFADRKQ